MTAALDPMVLGPLMIAITVVWFGAMSWAGMHEDEAPRGATRPRALDEPGPWWTNDGFDVPLEPALVPGEPDRRSH
jgi:hypothetical protein